MVYARIEKIIFRNIIVSWISLFLILLEKISFFLSWKQWNWKIFVKILFNLYVISVTFKKQRHICICKTLENPITYVYTRLYISTYVYTYLIPLYYIIYEKVRKDVSCSAEICNALQRLYYTLRFTCYSIAIQRCISFYPSENKPDCSPTL